MSDRLIYALTDPRTEEVRYVGLSTRGSARPNLHRKVPRSDDRTYRANWIRNLQASGLQPEWCVLEFCKTVAELSAAEQFWIDHYTHRGFDLTNHRSGGFNGCPDSVTKAKVSASLTGHKRSPETRRRMSEAKLGASNPMFGQKRSADARRRTSEANAGSGNPNFGKRVSDEQRAKISESLRGNVPWNKRKTEE